jgi:hypothetical protein
MNDLTYTQVLTLDGAQLETLRYALADAVELQTESVDSYCADCELSAEWCDMHQAEQEQRQAYSELADSIEMQVEADLQAEADLEMEL